MKGSSRALFDAVLYLASVGSAVGVTNMLGTGGCRERTDKMVSFQFCCVVGCCMCTRVHLGYKIWVKIYIFGCRITHYFIELNL